MRWKAQSRGSTRAQRRVLGSGRPLRRAEPSFPGLFPSASCSWSSLCSPGRSLPLSQKRRLLLDSTGQPGHRRLFPLFLLRPEHLPQPCHPAESLRQSPEAVSRVWGTTDRARPSWPPRPTPSGLPHSARAGAPSLGCSRRSSFCRSGSRQRRLLWGQAGPCGRASRLPREEPRPRPRSAPAGGRHSSPSVRRLSGPSRGGCQRPSPVSRCAHRLRACVPYPAAAYTALSRGRCLVSRHRPHKFMRFSSVPSCFAHLLGAVSGGAAGRTARAPRRPRWRSAHLPGRVFLALSARPISL